MTSIHSSINEANLMSAFQFWPFRPRRRGRTQRVEKEEEEGRRSPTTKKEGPDRETARQGMGEEEEEAVEAEEVTGTHRGHTGRKQINVMMARLEMVRFPPYDKGAGREGGMLIRGRDNSVGGLGTEEGRRGRSPLQIKRGNGIRGRGLKKENFESCCYRSLSFRPSIPPRVFSTFFLSLLRGWSNSCSSGRTDGQFKTSLSKGVCVPPSLPYSVTLAF